MPKKPFLTHSEKHWTPPEATVVVSKKRLQQILKALRLVSGMHNSKERNTVVDNLICDSIEYIEGAIKGVYEKKEKNMLPSILQKLVLILIKEIQDIQN